MVVVAVAETRRLSKVGFVRRAVRDMIAVDLANGNEAELITKFKTKGDDI